MYVCNVFPVVSQWDSYKELNLTQDGAPPHFALSVRWWLDNSFLHRWIGREEKKNNCLRDAPIFDFLFWVLGQISNRVWCVYAPLNFLRKIVLSVRSRLQTCVCRLLEHMLK